jgi:hypothetical protein
LAEIQRALQAQQESVTRAVTSDREAVSLALGREISAHNGELRALVTGLKETLSDRAVAQAGAGSGPRKGHSYEAECLQLFTRLAAPTDGAATAVGAQAGLDGSRAGDLVVELVSLGSPPPVLVVEAKNRPASGAALSVAEWRRTLAAARTSRGAHVACGITPSGQMPGGGAHRLLVLDERSILLAWEPGDPEDLCAAALALLRLTAASLSRGDSAADTGLLSQRLAEFVHAMRPLDTVQSQAAAAGRAAAKITAAAAELRVGLEERMTALQAAISP